MRTPKPPIWDVLVPKNKIINNLTLNNDAVGTISERTGDRAPFTARRT
jgi:hypothetical protein